jgi:predicted nuclease with RNAse H fold
MFIGIDYGAQLAGTTVICSRERGLFRFERSIKGQETDPWMMQRVAEMNPSAVYMDAPLSLPAAYYDKGTDHFFRLADRETGGMSPMFLGGMTARAIKAATHWRANGINVFEAYPSALVRMEWDYLKIPKRRTIPQHHLRLMAGMFHLPPPAPKDRHEADAWLCWLVGHRHQHGQARTFGDHSEGLILA